MRKNSKEKGQEGRLNGKREDLGEVFGESKEEFSEEGFEQETKGELSRVSSRNGGREKNLNKRNQGES